MYHKPITEPLKNKFYFKKMSKWRRLGKSTWFYPTLILNGSRSCLVSILLFPNQISHHWLSPQSGILFLPGFLNLGKILQKGKRVRYSPLAWWMPLVTQQSLNKPFESFSRRQPMDGDRLAQLGAATVPSLTCAKCWFFGKCVPGACASPSECNCPWVGY